MYIFRLDRYLTGQFRSILIFHFAASGTLLKKMCVESEQDQGEMLKCCVGQKADVILPSSVEARSWDSSLDKLLESSYGTALFRAFLQREYAEENLDFVIKVERYREISAKKREREAWKMYRTYIAIGAPHELNLDILSRKVKMESILIRKTNSRLWFR